MRQLGTTLATKISWSPRWIRRAVALVVTITGITAAPVSVYAYPPIQILLDCTDPGDEYLYDSQGSGDVTAWVTNDDNVVVGSATVTPVVGFVRIDAPVDTDYEKVWVSYDGTETRGPRVTPDCQGREIAVATPDNGGGLTPITPSRLYDTRTTDDRLGPASTIKVQASGVGGVPSSAKTVMVNLAAVTPLGPGHLTVYPCDQPRPNTAAVTYLAGETRAGASLVELDSTGKLCVYSHAAADVVVDVEGYAASSSNPVAIRPLRVLDTRITGEPVAGTLTLDFGEYYSDLDLPDDLPWSEVAGLFINVSAVRAALPGNLAVYSSAAEGDGSTARLNYEVGRPQTNLVFTPIDRGQIDVVTSSSTDVIIDVVAIARHPDTLVPVSDFRLLDTRNGVSNVTTDGQFQGTGRLEPGVPQFVQIGGRLDDLSPTAALLNVAVVNPSASTHVTVYPCGAAVPNVSSGNVPAGKVIPNAVLVPIGTGSGVCVVSPIETDVVIDLEAVTTTEPVGLYFSTCPTTVAWPGDRIAGGSPPYTISGSVPPVYAVEYFGGVFGVRQPNYYWEVTDLDLTITDSRGQTLSFHAVRSFLGPPPRPYC